MEYKFYLTMEGKDGILYETSSSKMIKQVAMDLLVDEGKKVFIHNRQNGKTVSVPDDEARQTASRCPVVGFNAIGNPCYIWKADNPARNDSAEYDTRTKVLVIGSKVIEGHPEFRGMKPFREFVQRYLVECRDGFDPRKELDGMTDISQMAGYINRNLKTWKNEVFPYLEKYGWLSRTDGAEIIGRQGNRLLSVSVKGLATVITDNSRMDIAEKLQRRIKQTGLPMTAVAERSGVPVSNIYKILKGTYNPSLDLMERLADAVGMKIDLVEK